MDDLDTTDVAMSCEEEVLVDEASETRQCAPKFTPLKRKVEVIKATVKPQQRYVAILRNCLNFMIQLHVSPSPFNSYLLFFVMLLSALVLVI